MTPALALLLIGGILLKAGFSNRSIIDTMLGREGEDNPKARVPSAPDYGGGDFAPGQAAGPGGTEGTDPATTNLGGGGYMRLVQAMNRISSLNLPYRWGGGHAPGYNSPRGPFDCSGAVSYALHEAGLYNGPPLTSGLFMAWGEPGRGQSITIYTNPTHVFIHDEKTGRDWGTTKTVGPGGPQWHRHATRGFVARHPKGL